MTTTDHLVAGEPADLDAGPPGAGQRKGGAPRGRALLQRLGGSSVLRYAGKRFIVSIPMLLGVVVVMFVLMELAPGDPIQAMLGDFPASAEYVEQMEEEFKLDRPASERFISYVGNLAQGNLGYSFANRQPVSSLILERMTNTLLLTVSALTLSAIIGVTLGVLAAKSKRRSSDTGITIFSLAGFSVPVFWFGQILIIIFAVQLDWLPAQGMRSLRDSSEGVAGMLDVGAHLLLPVIALSMRELGINSRMTRASMLETLNKDYMLTARAKGVREWPMVLRHGLRNALIPVVTVIGYGFGYALSGSVLVETVFGWPGMGRLLFDSIGRRDNPVIIGIFLVIALTVIIVNFITDLVYGILDPRVRSR